MPLKDLLAYVSKLATRCESVPKVAKHQSSLVLQVQPKRVFLFFSQLLQLNCNWTKSWASVVHFLSKSSVPWPWSPKQRGDGSVGCDGPGPASSDGPWILKSAGQTGGVHAHHLFLNDFREVQPMEPCHEPLDAKCQVLASRIFWRWRGTTGF